MFGNSAVIGHLTKITGFNLAASTLALELNGWISWLVDLRLLLCAVIGIPIGISFRLGLLHRIHRSRQEMLGDLQFSGMIALFNLVVTLSLATRLDLEYLDTMMLAMAIAATGDTVALKAIDAVTKTRSRNITGDLGNKREDG